MKKTFSLIAVFLVLISCNDTSTTDTDPGSSKPGETGSVMQACPGDVNASVTESVGTQMINHFNDIYRRHGKPDFKDSLTASVWIDSCVIIALGEFLLKHEKEYDGVRIYNCAYKGKSPSRPRQKYQNESSILIQLTVPSTNADGSLGHRSVDTNFDFPTCKPEFQNFNLKPGQADKMIGHFNKLYRKSRAEDQSRDAAIDSLSLGVWFKSCVIEALANDLKNTSNNLDGILVFGAAYDQMIPNLGGQFKANQSTFVVVVSSPDGKGGHTPNWNVNKIAEKDFRPKFLNGYNHGELCPDLCN